MHGCNCSIKKSPSMKKWMARADPSKEASAVKKLMAGHYSSFEIQFHNTLKNGQLQVVFWKKRIAFTKIWWFE